jgi:N utilization substance protein B
MKGRRLARATALQALYIIDVSGIPEEVALATQQETLDSLKENDSSFSRDLVLGTRKFLSQIDQKIAEAATHWRIDRMTSVDRNILRLSTYELSYVPKTPAKVAINEAIEIAREFSTEESARFVNGILDKISKAP